MAEVSSDGTVLGEGKGGDEMSMTVDQLMDALSKLDGDTVVVLAKDEEGNGWSPLDELQVGVYQPETTWSGEFYEQDIIGDHDYNQPDKGDESFPAVCLWPVN